MPEAIFPTVRRASRRGPPRAASAAHNELARIVTGVRNDYQVAGDREKSLERELTILKEKFAETSQANVRLHELEREAQAQRALFEQFLNRAKETGEQQSLQIADARIIRRRWFRSSRIVRPPSCC
jgi:polysaccharide biosynthesis transport protein